MLYSTDMSQIALVSRKAGDFVATNDLATLDNGRYDLGDGDYVNVMQYTPKLRCEGSYESHIEYVDIQAVLVGAELMEVIDVEGLDTRSPYDPSSDCALSDGQRSGERFLLVPARFCLVTPRDAHMPGIAPNNNPTPVKKAVFKIRVEHLEHA